MANISDGLKDIFLAGVGAVALTGEKAKELIDSLIAKGELTVEQGKQINEDLKAKGADAAQNMRFDVLQTVINAMTPEQREQFVKKTQEFADKAAQAVGTVEDQAAEAHAADSAVEGEAEILKVDDVPSVDAQGEEAGEVAQAVQEADATAQAGDETTQAAH